MMLQCENSLIGKTAASKTAVLGSSPSSLAIHVSSFMPVKHF